MSSLNFLKQISRSLEPENITSIFNYVLDTKDVQMMKLDAHIKTLDNVSQKLTIFKEKAVLNAKCLVSQLNIAISK